MKTILLIFGIILTLIILVGADLRNQKLSVTQNAAKKPCYGYTIIEFGKGVNCEGDTIRLTKVPGGQELAEVN